MTVVDGFMPPGTFKDGFRQPMGFEHILPSTGASKPRRAHMPLKPIEDYCYFVALVVVEDGTIQMRSSQEMKEYKRVILDDAAHKFNEIMSDFIEQPGPPIRHRSLHASTLPLVTRESRLPPCSRKSTKRRHHGAFHGMEQPCFKRPDLKMDIKQPAQSGRQLQIRVDDRRAQAKWFSDAFKAVQQVGCRTIAKVWIKKIHPKKQSTHPYNGLFPRDLPADPHRTRPPYWPEDVIHKEPDHIDRSARTALLVHLIMNTPQTQIKAPQDNDTRITARDLFIALEEKRNDFKADRWNIIAEIISAREQIEMFDDGGFDGDTVIHVPDFSESARSARGELEEESEDNDASVPNAATGGEIKQENPEEENGSTPLPSTAPSPIGLAQTNDQHASHCQQDPRGNEAQRDRKLSHHNTNSFSPTMNNFTNTSSEQDCTVMTVDAQPFAGEPKPDQPEHRLQEPRLHHGLTRFQSHDRQQQELVAQHWLPNESHTGYPPPGYTLEGLHPQTQMSPQGFGILESALLHADPQGLALANGLPIMGSMEFNEYPAHSRPLPVRAMSTPHPIMLDQAVHGAHGMGVVQAAFYS